MDFVKHRYSDLNTLLDRVHQQFEHWEANGSPSPTLDVETLHLVKLAVHEWLANLVQHADFGGRKPEVSINMTPNGERIRCMITDNSEGFDLKAHLSIREAMIEPCPERGMGLLMLDACTDELSYHRMENGRHCLDFSVSADRDPWLNIPFS